MGSLVRGHLETRFERSFDVTALATDERPIYLLDSELRIVWANRPLEEWGPGRLYCDSISGPLRDFFRRWMYRTMKAAEPREWGYACPTRLATQVFSVRAHPFEGRAGLLLVHTRVYERLRETGSEPPVDEARYRDERGWVHQCGNCRQVRATGADWWERVIPWLETPPPQTTHGICPVCLDYYYAVGPLTPPRGAPVGDPVS